MRFLRATGFLATTLGALALAACGRPDLHTDLRPEGPPDLLTVMVRTTDFIPTVNGIEIQAEPAVYCKANDDKVPTIIGLPSQAVYQVCPETADDPPLTPVTNADPTNMSIRLVFDELLDTAVETLTDTDTGGPCTATSLTCDGHLASTAPVTLMCGGTAVAYDGYYVPNGNVVSWPPGPALVVEPTDFIATSAACTISLKDSILDKQGNVVPADQRGPYSFSLAAMTIIATDPQDGDEIANDSPAVIQFNAPIDAATVNAVDVTADDGAAVAVDLTVNGDTIEILPTSGTWAVGPDITITVPATATISDIGGGAYVPDGDFTLTFTAAIP